MIQTNNIDQECERKMYENIDSIVPVNGYMSPCVGCCCCWKPLEYDAYLSLSLAIDIFIRSKKSIVGGYYLRFFCPWGFLSTLRFASSECITEERKWRAYKLRNKGSMGFRLVIQIQERDWPDYHMLANITFP